MDDVDLRICELLFNNSRCPHRELASMLGISVTAVHRRVESLIDEGIIKEFTANISKSYLKRLSRPRWMAYAIADSSSRC